jgi:hypothetical protein
MSPGELFDWGVAIGVLGMGLAVIGAGIAGAISFILAAFGYESKVQQKEDET